MANEIENLKLKLPAQVFGKNITTERDEAIVLLQRVKEVKTEAQKIELDAYVKVAKNLRKIGSDLRLIETRKVDQLKSLFTDAEKDFFKYLDEHIKSAESFINEFNKAQLAKVRAEQARIDAEEQERLKRLRSPASMAKVEAEFSVKKEAAAAEMPKGIKRVWTWEVDLGHLPSSFILDALLDFYLDTNTYPDFLKKALDKFVKNGGRELPGVKIYEDVIRSGR